MKNCLLTEVKSVVDNNDLKYLGAVVFKASSSLKARISACGERVKIRVDGTGYFARSIADLSDPSKRITEITLPNSSSETTLYFIEGDYNIYIENKYNLTRITTSSNGSARLATELSDYDWCESLTFFSTGIADTSSASYPEVAGDISQLLRISSLQSLLLVNCTSVTGDLDTLCSFPALTNFDLVKTQIKGELESYISKCIAKGRTTITEDAPIAINRSLQENLTANGKHISNFCFVTWDSATKYAVFKGNTSNFSEVSTVYYKNATEEQISAWQVAGLTVRDLDNL